VIAFRLAERALRENESRLSMILERAPGAVGIFDCEGRFVLRGGSLRKLWGDALPSRDAASRRCWQGFAANGELLSTSQNPDARALRGETVSPGLNFMHTAGDGHETWIRVSAAPLRNEGGEIIGGMTILENVDAEKRAEQRLAKSEAWLRAAIDPMKLGRYTWNLQTKALQWDDTMRAMWGLPAGAPVDHELWRAAVHPEDLARVEAAIERGLDPQGDGVCDVEYRVIGKADGVERRIATRGKANFENNLPLCIHGLALDITDRTAESLL
jgi:PAS domain S-box-containing protein